ncbi:MAG: hypothetical protein V1792_13350 [Pseudomonadota bacterium]
MKRIGTAALAVLVVLAIGAFPGTPWAWEFELEGGLSWNYYYATQAGDEGFFGPYNVDASGNNIQNQNFWAGANKWPGVFPGHDVAVNTQFMEFSPTFRVNEAISIKGAYYVGSWEEFAPELGAGALVASEYANSTFTGTGFSFSPGFWNLLWFEAETPWGTVGLGKRPFAFGIGALASGEDVTSTEALQLTVPYGPLSVGLLWFPWRQADDVSAAFIAGDAAMTPDVEISVQTENKSVQQSPHLTGFMVYNACNFSVGYLYDYFRWSLGPENLIVSNGATAADRLLARNLFIPRDLTSQFHILYAKYASGSFFANAEFDYWESTVRHGANGNNTDENSGPASVGGFAGAGSVFQTNHTEMLRFAMDLGAVAGPSKVTLFGFWSSGFDRRAGVLIDKQGAGLWVGPQNTTDALLTIHPNWANTILFNPYSYLMVFNYGGGNNSFNRNGDGYLTDAFAYAVRLDYSVAANLNFWASFFKANRVSKGYGWGYIQPDLEGDAAYNRLPGYGATAVPAIPDDDLGWEANAGLDWALLEGLELNTRVSYWRPGKWFSYACISRANPGWAAPAAGNLYGTNPNRTIDPVLGLEATITAGF